MTWWISTHFICQKIYSSIYIHSAWRDRWRGREEMYIKKNVKETMINFITRTSKIWRWGRRKHCTIKRACLVAVTDETCDGEVRYEEEEKKKCKVRRFIIVYINLTFTNVFGRYSMKCMWMTLQSMISIIVKYLHSMSNCGALTPSFYCILLGSFMLQNLLFQNICKVSLQF